MSTDKTAIAVDAKALEAAQYTLEDAIRWGCEPADGLASAIVTYLSALPHAGVSEDDPELDGTDAAHPAWWRGNDRGCEATCEIITRILDGETPSGVCREPLETVRRRVAALPSQHAVAVPVADTWFADRSLPVMAMSGDVESDRVLKLHFRRPVTDADRKEVTAALNLHQASLASSPSPAYAEPGIKALLWTSTHDGDWLRAESLGLVYEIRNDEVADYKKAQCQSDFEARIRSALVPATSPAKGGAEVEALADFLCSEFDADFNPVVGAVWPEHENDDGYRDGGFVRLQPSDVQAHARGNARRILTFLGQRVLRTSAPVGRQAAPSASDQSEA